MDKDEPQSRLPRITTNSRGTTVSSRYYCGGKNHQKRECPLLERHVKDGVKHMCHKCELEGHLQWACSRKNIPLVPNERMTSTKNELSATTGSSSGAVVKRVNKVCGNEDDSPFYKMVKVDGHEVKSFIDLGSDRSLVTRATLGTLQLISEPIEPVVLKLSRISGLLLRNAV